MEPIIRMAPDYVLYLIAQNKMTVGKDEKLIKSQHNKKSTNMLIAKTIYAGSKYPLACFKINNIHKTVESNS